MHQLGKESIPAVLKLLQSSVRVCFFSDIGLELDIIDISELQKDAMGDYLGRLLITNNRRAYKEIAHISKAFCTLYGQI